jgi:multiple sugar transport system permease protein
MHLNPQEGQGQESSLLAPGMAEAAAREEARAREVAPRMGVLRRLLEHEKVLAGLLLLPTLLILSLFIAYPFAKGIWLSLSSATVGNPGVFIGGKNFVRVWNDSIFRQAAQNTFIYTAIATVLKLSLGMALALLLNHHFRGKRLIRASILLPFIIPTVLSTFAWRWMLDPTFSVINWTLYYSGLITQRVPWLSDTNMALGSVIIVNTWRGVPFFAITLLAGLQTVNPELHEAAAMDGANGWQRFWRITWPLLLPVTMVVVLFSVIQTFADFQLVYVLTGGGPANSTHLFATYAYQIGVGTGLLGEGAAISLAMFPILLVIVILQLWYIRRVEGA